MIMGKVAGANIIPGRGPNAGVQIQLRTPTSQFKSTSPMFIVDATDFSKLGPAAMGDQVAALGQRHAASGAVEQPGLQVGFQLGHVARCGRRREPKAAGGLGEASGFNHLGENLDCF